MENKNSKNKWATLFILTFCMIITSMSSSLLYTALNQLIKDFGVEVTTAQWLTTSYMLICAILIPISAYLVRKFKNKNMLITALSLFAIGSFVCGFSHSFNVMLAGRIIQSLGAGSLVTLTTNVIMAIFPKEERGEAMGVYGLGVLLAPAFGPTITGYFIDNFTWNTLFFIIGGLAVVAIILVVIFFKYENQVQDLTLDVSGVILSSIGFGSLLYGINLISDNGIKDQTVLIFLGIAFVTITAFVITSLRKEKPLLDLTIFKDLNFTFSVILVGIIQVALYGGMLLLPIFIQTGLGKTATESGLSMMPGTIVLGITGIFAGKMFDKYGIKMIASIGTLLIALSTLYFSHMDLNTPYYAIILIYALQSFGMAFVVMPLQSASVVNIETKDLPNANAIFSTSKAIMSSLSGVVLVLVMTNTAEGYIDSINRTIVMNDGYDALVKGIDTAFTLAFVIAVIAFLFSLFLKRKTTTENNTITKNMGDDFVLE